MLVSSSVPDLFTTNGDTVATKAGNFLKSIDFDFNSDGDVAYSGEAGLGLDQNSDGDIVDATVSGVYAVEAEAPNATVLMTFIVGL